MGREVPSDLKKSIPAGMPQTLLEIVGYISSDPKSLFRSRREIGEVSKSEPLVVLYSLLPDSTQFQVLEDRERNVNLIVTREDREFGDPTPPAYTVYMSYTTASHGRRSSFSISWRGVSPTGAGTLNSKKSNIIDRWASADDETRQQIINDIAAASELAKKGANLRDGDKTLLNELDQRRCVRI